MDIEYFLKSKPGYAFAHMEEIFWFNVLEKSLAYCDDNVDKTARQLGISSVTVRNWCSRLGIELKGQTKKKILDDPDYAQHVKMILQTSKNVEEAAKKLKLTKTSVYRYMRFLKIDTKLVGSKL